MDNDITASKGLFRAEYDRLLTDMAAGRLDEIVVHWQDRIGRTPLEVELFAVQSRALIGRTLGLEHQPRRHFRRPRAPSSMGYLYRCL